MDRLEIPAPIEISIESQAGLRSLHIDTLSVSQLWLCHSIVEYEYANANEPALLIGHWIVKSELFT